MAEQEQAPDWVVNEVLPTLEGPARSVQMLSDKSAIVLGVRSAIVAEKGKLSGLRMYRVDYPAGFLVNGAECPHCHEPLMEPVAKIAHLADPSRPASPASEPPRALETDQETEPSVLTQKQVAQRKYAAGMKGVRARAAKSKGGKGPVRERAAAKALAKKHGVKTPSSKKGAKKKR